MPARGSAPTETHSPLASEWSVSPRQRTPGKSPPPHGTRWALRSPVAAKQSSSLKNAHVLAWDLRRVVGHLNASSDPGYPRGDSLLAKTNARCSLSPLFLGSTSPCLSYKANWFCGFFPSSPPLLRISIFDTAELSLKVTEPTTLSSLHPCVF